MSKRKLYQNDSCLNQAIHNQSMSKSIQRGSFTYSMTRNGYQENQMMNSYNERDQLVECHQRENNKLKNRCQGYEKQVQKMKKKLKAAGSTKDMLLERNQKYAKTVSDMVKEIQALKTDPQAETKINSLEKQVEEGTNKIQTLLKENKALNKEIKARNEKFRKLKEVKDQTIDMLKLENNDLATKIKVQKAESIKEQLKTIDEQTKALKAKDDIIQSTEVIREYIEVHTIDDDDKETNRNEHCKGCQCASNQEYLFESDLSKKIKIEVKSKIKSEKH